MRAQQASYSEKEVLLTLNCVTEDGCILGCDSVQFGTYVSEFQNNLLPPKSEKLAALQYQHRSTRPYVVIPHKATITGTAVHKLKSQQVQQNPQSPNTMYITYTTRSVRAGIVQWVQRLGMCFTVRGSKPGETRFSGPSRPALGLTQPLIQWVPGHSPGYSGRRVALTTCPHLALKLKKQHYTCTPPWALMACYRVNSFA